MSDRCKYCSARIYQCECSNGSLHRRIEELEDCIRTLSFAACPKHHITDEQIAATVYFIENFYNTERKLPLALKDDVQRRLWTVLNKLGIERCEECGGSGGITSYEATGSLDGDSSICPNCNGKGWTME